MSKPTLESPQSIRIYFLAAPEDQDVCEAIHKHLAPIVRHSEIPIEVESDFNIPSGADREKHKQRLFSADIVLSIISADFINNDAIYERNQKVTERYNNHETVMIPILVRNCLWKSTPFARLPLLPKNLQPLNNKQFWNSPDDALTAVVTDIYDSVNEFIREETVDLTSSEVMKIASDIKGAAEKSQSKSEAAAPAETELPDEATADSVSSVEAETALPEPEIISPKAQARVKASAPVEVDWRKRYYRRVLWKRGLALVIDLLVLGFVIPFIAYLILIPLNIVDEVEFTFADAAIFLGSFYVLAPLMESSKFRATVGKLILKIQITDEGGGRIGFFRAFWRNLLRTLVLYSYALIIPLIVQFFTFKKTKKLFHDQLSNTVIGERMTG